MPFLDDQGSILRAGVTPRFREPPAAPSHGGWAVLGAAFRQDNSLGSGLAAAAARARGAPQSAVDPDFDPLDGLEDHYLPYASALAEADSAGELAAIKGRVDAELRDKRMLAEAGMGGLAASFAAGLLDPLNFIPVGGAVYRSGRMGWSVARSAGSFALAGAASATAVESALRATQIARSWEESGESVAAGALLAGVLGGGASVAYRAFGRLRGRNPGTDLRGEAAAAGQEFQAEIAPRPEGQPDPVEPRSIILSRADIEADAARAEAELLGRAYRQVLDDPHGPALDPGVWIGQGLEAENIRAVLVARGGFRNVNELEVGRQGWGLVKVIWRHGERSEVAPEFRVHESDVLALPDVVRRYEPIPNERPDPGSRTWIVADPDNPSRRVLYAVNPRQGADTLVSIFVVEPDAAQARLPNSLRRAQNDAGGPAASPGNVFSITGDTASAGPQTRSEGAAGAAGKAEGSVGLADGQAGSLSAASPYNAAESRLLNALGLDRFFGSKLPFVQDFLSAPQLLAWRSPSIQARELVQALAETPYAIEANAKGIATKQAVESFVKGWQGMAALALSDVNDLWLKSIGKAGGSARWNALRDLGRGRAAFMREVGRAMRRGDQHEIPEVAQAARLLRERVFEPLKLRAVEAGLLPEDVKVEDAISYFSRVYDTDKIIAYKPQFAAILLKRFRADDAERQGLRDEVSDLAAERAGLLRLLDRTAAKIQRRDARAADLATRRDEASRGARQAVRRGFDLGARRDAAQKLRDAAARDAALQDRLPDVLRQPKRRALSLSTWLARNGGVKEYGGDLLAAGARERPGLINNASGKHVDDAALAAWEAGYFPDHAERPDVNDFLDALANDLGGFKRYSEHDFDLVQSWRWHDEAWERLGEAGIDPRGMDDAALFAALNKADLKDEARALGLDLSDADAERLSIPLDDLGAEGEAASLARDDYRDWLRLNLKEDGTGEIPAGQRSVVEFRRGRELFAAYVKAVDAIPAKKTTPRAVRNRMDARLRNLRVRGDEADWQGSQLRGRAAALAERLQTARGDAAALRVLRDDIGARLEDVAERLDDAVAQWPGRSDSADAILKWRGARDEAELLDDVEQTIDHILNAPGARNPIEPVEIIPRRDDPAARGPLRRRTLHIDDIEIEDFLVSDADVVLEYYVRTMAADVELKRAFGDIEARPQIQAIRDEYTALARRAETPEARKRIEEDSARMVGIMEMLVGRLRGTFGAPRDPTSLPVRMARAARDWNYLRMMGMMTVSAIADLGRPVMVYGLERTLGAAARLIADPKLYKLAQREAMQAGTAFDLVLAGRAANLADLGDDFRRLNRFERGMKAIADHYGVAALMAPWNAALKTFTAAMAGHHFVDGAMRWAAGKADPRTIQALAAAGIDEGTARLIADQARRHGRLHGEGAAALWLPGTEAWDNAVAVEAFRAALVRDVDRIIVTPGIGDRPAWMSSELGKLIGQFKSFSFASAQRVAVAGLQQRDMAALNGLLLSTGLGVAVYGIAGSLSGRELSNNPAVWLAEGIDKAGYTGWLFDVHNTIEKATGGGFGVGALMGAPPNSRYASRGVVSSLLGPTIGLAEDFAKIASNLGPENDWTASDTRAVRRLLPAQNLFYLRGLLDRAEAGGNDLFGIPETQR